MTLQNLLPPTPRAAIAAMAVAMLIFGANFAVSRYGVRHGLTAYDLVFLRFGIAGPLLLPVFWRAGWRDCAGLGWGRGAILAATSGAPITLFMSLGVTFAPAAHGAALAPGTVTVVGIVYATVIAGMLPRWPTRVGLALVLGGLAAIALAGTTSGSPLVVLGDGFCVLAGLLWGFYPVLLHRWRVGGITGAAVCAVLSLAYVPVYVAFLHPQLLNVSLGLVLFQAVYQGVFNSVVGLWLWGHGVRVLGASGTQLYPPLIPVIGAISAIPILAEWPGPLQLLGVGLIVGGLVLAALGSRARRSPSTEP